MQPQPASPRDEGERVRFCLGCAEVLPFDLRLCPACGRREPIDGAEEAVVPCAACGASRPASRLYCPRCGRPVAADPAPPAPVDRRGGGRGERRLARAGAVLALLAPALATLALVQRILAGSAG